MIPPHLATPDALRLLQHQWRDAPGVLRIPRALDPSLAAACLEALRARPHAPAHHLHPPEAYQLWRFSWTPDDLDTPLSLLGRWLHGDAADWLSRVTSLPLTPPSDRTLLSDRVAKSSFFDAYDEAGDGRALAFQLHLTPTPTPWPQAQGGHLELLDARDGQVTARLPPRWNTLDIFDVRSPGAWRRMPMILEHFEGYTVSGWLHLAPQT